MSDLYIVVQVSTSTRYDSEQSRIKEETSISIPYVFDNFDDARVAADKKRAAHITTFIERVGHNPLDARVAELESDNAKLRGAVAALGERLAQYELFREVVGDPASEFASLRRELHRVERGNAKLRELLVEAVKVADNYYRGFGFMNDIDAIKSEMRGLGIEVE